MIRAALLLLLVPALLSGGRRPPLERALRGAGEAPLAETGAWLAETPLNAPGSLNLALSRMTAPDVPPNARALPRVEYCRMNLFHTRPTPAFLWLGVLNPVDHVGVLVDRHWELVDPVIWSKPRSFLPSSRPEALDRLRDPLTKERGTWLLRSLRLGLPVHCEPVHAGAEAGRRGETETIDLLLCAHRELLARKPEYHFFGYNCGGSASDALRAAGLTAPFASNLRIGDRVRFGNGARAAAASEGEIADACRAKLEGWNRIDEALRRGRAPSSADRDLAERTIAEFAGDLRMPGVSWDRVRDWEAARAAWLAPALSKADLSYARTLAR